MAIGPVGLQIIVRSATAAKNAESSDLEKSQLLNKQFQEKFQKQVDIMKVKVPESNKLLQTKEDKNRKSKKEEKDKDSKKNKKTETDNIIKKNSTSIFDKQI